MRTINFDIFPYKKGFFVIFLKIFLKLFFLVSKYNDDIQVVNS